MSFEEPDRVGPDEIVDRFSEPDSDVEACIWQNKCPKHEAGECEPGNCRDYDFHDPEDDLPELAVDSETAEE